MIYVEALMRSKSLSKESPLSINDFAQYDGGDTFIFQNSVFFKEEKELGRGSYGKVFCFKSSNNYSVAVKCELGKLGQYHNGHDFQSEAQWYQRIYGLGEFSGDADNLNSPHYILMPFFKGKMLYELRFSSEHALIQCWIKTAIMTQRLHQHYNIVHCDLKTDNVIYGEQVFVIDFGLAAVVNSFRKNSIQNTRINKHILVQHAPEVFSDANAKQRALPQHDAYSLGIILKQLYRIFMQGEHTNQITLKGFDIIKTTQFHLTNDDSVQRWSISKAIYMLTLSFFTQIPYALWTHHEPVLTQTHTIIDTWRAIVLTAIRIQVSILQSEKSYIENNGGQSKIKAEKLEGLHYLQSNIHIKNPDAFAELAREVKIKFPRLTAGIFSQRTQKLIEQCAALSCVLN